MTNTGREEPALDVKEKKGRRDGRHLQARQGANPTGPATCLTPPVGDQGIFKALWSVRTLDEHTLKGYGKLLRVIAHKISLDDPNAVERHILGISRKNKYKNNLLTAYSVYCKANGIEWVRPSRLRNEPCPIKVPTKQRIDLVISCSTPTYAMAFSLSKYGLRPDEVSKITFRDLDLGQRTLAVRTSKLGYSRTLQLDNKTVDKLRDYIARRKITRVDQRLFASGEKICDKWSLFRKRAFEKVRDPELLKIRFYISSPLVRDNTIHQDTRYLPCEISDGARALGDQARSHLRFAVHTDLGAGVGGGL